MKFDPVSLPEERALDGAVSVTFLRAFNACRRAAFLYQAERGGASEPQLERGSAYHAVMERGLNAAIETDNSEVPPELLKAIGDEVLADPEWHVPIEEHDLIREGLFRTASWLRFNPRRLVAVERMFFLDIGGWRVRMKIDYAELLEDGAAVLVRDWKTSRSAVSYDDIGRRFPSQDRIAAKTLQLILYGLGVVYGVPVIVTTGAFGERVETPAPFPVADRAQRVDLEYVYPSIEDKETGGPVLRSVSLTKTELADYRASVEGLLVRLTHAVESGDWRAIQGEGHCGECPAPKKCPIPAALRKWAPEIDTDVEAAAEAQSIEVEAERLKARRARLRNYVKRMPSQRLRFGADMVIEPVPTATVEIKDRDAFIEAARRTAEVGAPFEEHKFVKTRTGTPIRPRRLSAEELAEETQDEGEAAA